MLGEPHLRVLQELDRPDTPTELAERLDWSVKHTAETLSHLVDLGLVIKEEEGRPSRYRPAETRARERYTDLLNRHPNVSFPSLLTPSHLHVLFHLDEARTAKQLTALSKPSQATVYRVLKQLRNRGILVEGEGKSEYVVRGAYGSLVEFAREVALLEQTATVREHFPGGKNHVIWNNDYEHIAMIREVSGTPIQNVEDAWMPENDDLDGRYYLTGLEVLEDYDLRFLTTAGLHVFYTDDDLERRGANTQSRQSRNPSAGERRETPVLPLEDLACHLVLIQRRGTNQRYSLLFLAKFREQIDTAGLRKRAMHYDLADAMDELSTYLDTEGDVASEDLDLPSWHEFERVANEYEVAV